MLQVTSSDWACKCNLCRRTQRVECHWEQCSLLPAFIRPLGPHLFDLLLLLQLLDSGQMFQAHEQHSRAVHHGRVGDSKPLTICVMASGFW